MNEVMDVTFDIFWALVISIVLASAVGTLIVLSVVALVVWVVQRVRSTNDEDQ